MLAVKIFDELVGDEKFNKDQDILHDAINSALTGIHTPKGIDPQSYIEALIYAFSSSLMGATLAGFREDYGEKLFMKYKTALEERIDFFADEIASRKKVQ